MEIKAPSHFTKKTLIPQEEAEAMANKIAELEEENCKLRGGYSYPRITDHSQLEIGNQYWVRNKEENSFFIARYSEIILLCFMDEITEDCISAGIEIFGPIPEPIISGIE